MIPTEREHPAKWSQPPADPFASLRKGANGTVRVASEAIIVARARVIV